jgi:hypothetical protein
MFLLLTFFLPHVRLLLMPYLQRSAVGCILSDVKNALPRLWLLLCHAGGTAGRLDTMNQAR